MLKAADRLQRQLRKIRTLREADRRVRFTRDFPSRPGLRVFSLCQIDQRRQIVRLVRRRKSAIAEGRGPGDG